MDGRPTRPGSRRTLIHLVEAIDPDGTRPDDELPQARQTFTLRKTHDGTYACEGRLSASVGAKLAAVLI